MYKLIAIDVDDTLITSDKRITDRTRRALQLAADQGVIITLATGRMFASAKQVAKQLQLNVPIITYQGSLITQLFDESVLYERYVPMEISHIIFDYCERHQLHLQGYFEDEFYVKEENELTIGYSQLCDVPYQVEPDFQQLSKLPMTKLLIQDDPLKLDKIAEELSPILVEKAYMTKSKPHFLEIMHKEGTKGHALSFLANHYDIPMNQVMAIGDSWNDAEMLKVAGMGVAMANAVNSLKDISDFVTLSNEDDGVAHVIESYVLKQSLQS